MKRMVGRLKRFAIETDKKLKEAESYPRQAYQGMEAAIFGRTEEQIVSYERKGKKRKKVTKTRTVERGLHNIF